LPCNSPLNCPLLHNFVGARGGGIKGDCGHSSSSLIIFSFPFGKILVVFVVKLFSFVLIFPIFVVDVLGNNILFKFEGFFVKIFFSSLLDESS